MIDAVDDGIRLRAIENIEVARARQAQTSRAGRLIEWWPALGPVLGELAIHSDEGALVLELAAFVHDRVRRNQGSTQDAMLLRAGAGFVFADVLRAGMERLLGEEENEARAAGVSAEGARA